MTREDQAAPPRDVPSSCLPVTVFVLGLVLCRIAVTFVVTAPTGAGWRQNVPF